ncbi:DoxX family protein [Agriterribacter sp.]|uniref:DoxX family protein n=1 Tax=Agriterribacter sp. TaxID=2821509 RepID=UPI002C927E3C|nr:DoxX family protein [Agriterribacter sp.]HRO47521.1 DoxX family protein [Agriterribacter sp.]HRQ18313.1 DoxX family protein [Agriterribacter sp.]
MSETINTATAKVNSRQPSVFIILRIALGLILFWKSFNFIRDTAIAQTLIEHTGVGVFSANANVLALVITYLGLLCGFFIFIGLFTRIAAIVQLPVLIVAVIFVNMRSIGENKFEFFLSLITLLLLILFAIKGSGFFSADEYFRRGAAQDRRAKKAMN